MVCLPSPLKYLSSSNTANSSGASLAVPCTRVPFSCNADTDKLLSDLESRYHRIGTRWILPSSRFPPSRVVVRQPQDRSCLYNIQWFHRRKPSLPIIYKNGLENASPFASKLTIESQKSTIPSNKRQKWKGKGISFLKKKMLLHLVPFQKNLAFAVSIKPQHQRSAAIP